MKSGYVAIVGLPNVGKSSLVNALVKEDVSIVTSKPQTTRKRTLGIYTKKNEHQIIFVDTPGYVEDSHGLNKYLREEFMEALRDVDVIVATIGPWEFKAASKPWVLQELEQQSKPVIYAVTQSDRAVVNSESILKSWEGWKSEPLLGTSALTGEGLEELREKIISYMPDGPEYYDSEIYTVQTLREISAEAVRKSCFENLHQEIPYGLAVKIRDFKEEEIFKIHADIILSRESHKAMVIGQGGQKLKSIGTQCRLELEKNFGQKIFLKLHVVVKPQWVKDKEMLEELGYVSG